MKPSETQSPTGYSLFQRISRSLRTICANYYFQNTSEFWIMIGIGGLTFAVYLFTLAPGIVPGISAVAIGKALNLLPTVPVTHPFWLLASRMVAWIPTFDTPYCLNLFSAVCSSIAAAWLFRITKRVFFELIRATPTLRLVPIEDDDQESPARSTSSSEPFSTLLSEEDDATEHLIATLGGVATALCLAFSAPFWIASVSLHASPFNLLLFLAVTEFLACYHFTGKTDAYAACLFLFGIGMVESVIFVILLPLFLAIIVKTAIRYNQFSESFLLVMLLTGFSGLVLNLALLMLLSGSVDVFSFRSILHLVSHVAHSHIQELLGAMPKTGWLLVCFQTICPPLFGIVSIRRLSRQQGEAMRLKWGITNVLFTAFTLTCLINLPHTAWSIAREGSHLPVFPSLAIAVAVGCFFIYWCLMATQPTYNATFELGLPSLKIRLLSYGMCGLLSLFTLQMLYTHFDEANGRRTAFADHIADEVLKQLGPTRCLLTDSPLTLNLIVRAHVSHKKVSVLPCTPPPAASNRTNTPKAAPFRLVLSEPTNIPSPPAESFVEKWLREHPREHAQVAVVGTPSVWERAGFVSFPSGLIYIGLPPDNSVYEGKKLVSDLTAQCQRLAPLLADTPTLRPELRRVKTRLRNYVSRLANDVGVLLEKSGQAQEADVAYTEAIKIDSKNLCACLNQYGLRLRTQTLGPTRTLSDRIQSLTKGQPTLDAVFDHASVLYGNFAPQEADVLLPAIVKKEGAGPHPSATELQLWEQWLNCSSARPPQKSAFLTQLEQKCPSATPDVKLSHAIANLLAGESEVAETQLRKIVKEQPAHLSAWALLAEILMKRRAFNEVNETVIPAMRTTSNLTKQSQALIEMTQGCLFMQINPHRPAEARECFLRALEHDATLAAASEELLRADFLIGNTSTLEKDALKILSTLPDQAAANALLGSRRLAQKQYSEAEYFLRKSIGSQLTCGALNDLAELLRQQGKMPEAEQQARLAIRIKPDFSAAWDTLGNILLGEGRLDEANANLLCALALGSNDPRLYLTLIRLRIKQGLFQDANQILAYSKHFLNHASPAVLKEHEFLKKQLQAHTLSN